MTAPKRMMTKRTAAAYLDMSVAAFERELAKGTIPAPVMLGGKQHWCAKALDRAMDELTGTLSDAEKDLLRRYGKAA